MIDLRPAAEAMAELLTTLTGDDLTRTTPNDYSVAALVNHVGGLSLAFAAAARKDLGVLTATAPSADLPTDLPADWRTDYPDRVREVARAWAGPAAWEGTTQVGGVTLPAEEAGLVALDELVLHAWDLAVATGRAHEPDDGSVAVLEQFVASFPADGPAREGMFGPALPSAPDATPFERTLALAGRNPQWGRSLRT